MLTDADHDCDAVWDALLVSETETLILTDRDSDEVSDTCSVSDEENVDDGERVSDFDKISETEAENVWDRD